MESNAPLNDTRERVKLFVCVAPGCTNTTVNNNNVQFHSFPATQIGKLWQAALGTVASSSSSMAAVCSEHFRNEDYLEEQYLQGDVEKIRRTLKPEAIPCVFSSQSPKTNTSEQGGNKQLKEDAGGTEITLSEADKSYKREDKALWLLTQKFVEMLKSSPNGLLDINQASEELKISKRRIYDITNVLEGVLLLKKKSKRWVQWVGPKPVFMDERLGCLAAAENKLDDTIKYTKQQIHDLYENIVYNKFAYLTYDDVQSIPIFEDQAVFVIKAPPETTLEVAHPKKAFQMHIISKKGPVKVLGCTDTVDVTQSKSQVFDWDYSNLPLRGLSTAATSCKDNANQNTKSNDISKYPSEPTQRLTQVPSSRTPPEPTPVVPPHEVQNSAPPILPLSISIKEEITDVNITPYEALNENFTPHGHESDQLSTDVHMTDLS